jgi:DNA-binding transcriptional LysR family regulator
LAGKEEVTEADLAGEPLIWHADSSTQPTRRPHPNAGYVVRGVDETLEHVAAGRGISFLARSATVFYSHPDISYVPIPELAPEQVCLAVAASRLRKRPRSRQNVGTMKCGSVAAMPPQSTVEQSD